MADRELVNYFIEETNKRFLIIDTKLDTLFKFKWQIIGGSVGISSLVSIVISVLVLLFGGK